MLSEQITDHLDGLAEPLSIDDIVPPAETAPEGRMHWFVFAAAALAALVAVTGAMWWTRDDSTGSVTTADSPRPDVAGFGLEDAHLLDRSDYGPSSVTFAAAGSFGTGVVHEDRARVWVLDTSGGDPVMVIDSLPPGSADAQWLFVENSPGEAIEAGPLGDVGAFIHRSVSSADLTPQERDAREAADRASGQRRRDVIAWIDDAGKLQAVTGFAGSDELVDAAEQWAQSADIERVAAAVDASTTYGPSTTIVPAAMAIAYRQLPEGSDESTVQIATFDAPLARTVLVLGLEGSSRSFDDRSSYVVGDPPYLEIFEAGARTVAVSDAAAFGNPSIEPDLDSLVDAVRPIVTGDLDSLPAPQPAPGLTPGDDNSAASACGGIEIVADHPGTPAWVVAVSHAARMIPDAAPALNRLIDSSEPAGSGGPSVEELEEALGIPCRQIQGSVSFEVAADPEADPPWRLTATYGGLEDFCLGLSIGTEFQRMTRSRCLEDWDDPAGGLVVATVDGVTTVAGWTRDPTSTAQLASPPTGPPSPILTVDDARYVRDLAYEPSTRPFGYFVIQIPALGPDQRVEVELADTNGNRTTTLSSGLDATGPASAEPDEWFCELTEQIDAIYANADGRSLTTDDRSRIRERVEALAPLIPAEYEEDYRLRYWPTTSVAGLDTSGVSTQRAYDRMQRLFEQTCGPR
ncbi:MAG: hypothetical protein ACE367_16965 [Acidimicrobiales bacterium]